MLIMRQLRIVSIGLLFLWLLPAGATPVYPLKVSSSNPHILADQNNVPFMVVGDSSWSLVANLNVSDAATYIADRAAHGFNTLIVSALVNTYINGQANAQLLNGTLPFTGTISGGYYDLTKPNPTYFAYVDEVVSLCASNGINVMFDPIETGGWLTTMLANGSNSCLSYGEYLGNRYKNFPNIIWMNGNDFQTWTTPTNDAVVTAVAIGIKNEDPNHLQTVELNFLASSSLDDTNWTSIVGLNFAYTYYPTYAEVLHAYNQSSNTPAFLGEANFEYETNGNTDGGSTSNLRLQEYWTMTSGATGQLYGNHYTWSFYSGWQTHLDSPGVTQLGYMAGLFNSVKWYNLVPDQSHAFVTAGYGTYASTGSIDGNNYVTAALTPDGTLGMAYLPQGGTITVAMSKLQSNITARWFDPSTNSFTAIAGSPFSNTGTQSFKSPGKNNAGDPDWLLVLQTAALAPIPLNIRMTGSMVVLNWNDPQSAFSLYTSQSFTGPFTKITGATSPYTNAVTIPQMIFRLQAN
jgi:hypothetical protein